MASFTPGDTLEGELPPWEVAKAFAFHTVLQKAAEVLGTPAAELVGERVDEFIAKQLTLTGGGTPCARAVRKVIAKCREPSWYPGKPSEKRAGAGRPPAFSEHQRQEVARVAMDLKRKLVAPTPRKVRARLPEVSRNPETGSRMCDKTMRTIFTTLCYDEDEDDPWQYLPCASQDMLPSELLPLRVAAAKHVLRTTNPQSWRSHVAIDPCYSLLPKTAERQEEQQICAMGKVRYMSLGSRRNTVNLRGPTTANHQKGSNVTRVDWTPIFARGKVRIYIVDENTAQEDASLPKKLADAFNLAKFVVNVLPRELQNMQRKYHWADLPRVVVHDPASYMVTKCHERLHVGFATALHESGFRSWIGSTTDSTKWLVKKFSDVYIHETLIAHIRRLLNTDFAATRLYETPSQFLVRMQKVEDYMNSAEFSGPDGRGLLGLAKDLRSRCQEVVRRKGERIPK